MKEVPADRRLKGCPKLVVVHPIQVHTRDTVALGDDISVALGSASRLLLAPVFLSGTYKRQPAHFSCRFIARATLYPNTSWFLPVPLATGLGSEQKSLTRTGFIPGQISCLGCLVS